MSFMYGGRFIGRSLRSAARQLLIRRALILVYHRVTRLRSDPQWLCVEPQRFAEQLEILRQHYNPLHLSELHQRLRKGSVPRKAVVVTFDDGYADNLYQAKPLLERYDVPAACFVATGKLEERSEFWWDELESLLFETKILPDFLSLTVNGKTYSWLLSEQEPVTASQSDSAPRSWRVWEECVPTPRHKIYRELAPILRTLDAKTQDSVMQQLAGWAGVTRHVRETHRTLRTEEVIRLDEGGLVEVGAHTVTHPVLAVRCREAQQREVLLAKQQLENILYRPVTAFAYPFGGRDDYTAETVEIVRQGGFACACSNFPGWVRQGTSLHEFPRYLVRNWNGDEFARQLAGWYRG